MGFGNTLLKIATLGQVDKDADNAAKRNQKLKSQSVAKQSAGIAGTGVTMDQAQGAAASAALQAPEQQAANLQATKGAIQQARSGMENAFDVGASDYTRQAAQSLAAAQASAGGIGGSVMGAGRDIGGMAARDLAQYRAQQGQQMGQFDMAAQQGINQGELDRLQQIIQSNEYLYGIGDPQTQARQRFVSSYQPALDQALKDNSGIFDSGAGFQQMKQSLAAMETDPAVRNMILSYGG